MANSSPKVTAVVLFYNHENFVDECLNSVFSQTYDNMDVWLMDDGSNDNTLANINAYLSRYSHEIKHSYQCDFNTENIGLINQVNKLYEKAHDLGEFVAFFAGDDISFPDRIKESISIFESDKSIFGLSLGITKTTKHYDIDKIEGSLITKKINVFNLILNPLVHSPAPSRMLRREVFFKTPRLTRNMETEDTPLFWRTIMLGNYFYTNRLGVFYRIHELNINGGKKRRFNRKLIYEDRIMAINMSKLNFLIKFLLNWAAKRELKIREEIEKNYN